MKRAVTLFLVAVLVVAMVGCAPRSPKPSGLPKTDEPNSANGGEADGAQLWAALDGVWVNDNNIFIWFGADEDGKLIYTTGLMESGYIMGGELKAVQKTADDSYCLDILFPARAASEEDDGWDEFSKSIELTTNLSGEPKLIDATDVATDDWVRTFMYRGKSLEQASSMTVYNAWNKYAGIWAAEDDGMLSFVYFQTEDDGTQSYATGTLYSGYSVGGAVTGFVDYPSEGRFEVTVFAPAVENEMETRDAMEFAANVDCSQDYNGILRISHNDGAGALAYVYIAPNFSDLNEMDMQDIFTRVASENGEY